MENAILNASSDINRDTIKFKNKWCYCGNKDDILELQNNLSKLYFDHLQRKYKYYSFWTLDNEEFNNEKMQTVEKCQENTMRQVKCKCKRRLKH